MQRNRESENVPVVPADPELVGQSGPGFRLVVLPAFQGDDFEEFGCPSQLSRRLRLEKQQVPVGGA